jgi:hypothetical protein
MGSFINIPKNNWLDDTSSKRVVSLIAIDDSRNFGVLPYPEMHLVLMLIRLRCIVNARTGWETAARYSDAGQEPGDCGISALVQIARVIQ